MVPDVSYSNLHPPQDVAFDGGMFHIIDTDLTMPSAHTDIALDVGLTSIAGVFKTTGLLDGVPVLPEITVSAPNNAAFEAIGGDLGVVSQQDLIQLVEYHVLMNQHKFRTNCWEWSGTGTTSR